MTEDRICELEDQQINRIYPIWTTARKITKKKLKVLRTCKTVTLRSNSVSLESHKEKRMELKGYSKILAEKSVFGEKYKPTDAGSDQISNR